MGIVFFSKNGKYYLEFSKFSLSCVEELAWPFYTMYKTLISLITFHTYINLQCTGILLEFGT